MDNQPPGQRTITEYIRHFLFLCFNFYILCLGAFFSNLGTQFGRLNRHTGIENPMDAPLIESLVLKFTPILRRNGKFLQIFIKNPDRVPYFNTVFAYRIERNMHVKSLKNIFWLNKKHILKNLI